MATPQQQVSQYEAHLHYAAARVRYAEDTAIARGWEGEADDLSQVLYVLTQLLELSCNARRKRPGSQLRFPGVTPA